MNNEPVISPQIYHNKYFSLQCLQYSTKTLLMKTYIGRLIFYIFLTKMGTKQKLKGSSSQAFLAMTAKTIIIIVIYPVKN